VQAGSGLVGKCQGTGSVIHRMRGHDEDVYSLAWSPSMEVMIGEEKYMEWLVASISKSRDRTVRVWFSREGRAVHTQLPRIAGGKGRTVGTAGSV
jgi:WD40 repeat protein